MQNKTLFISILIFFEFFINLKGLYTTQQGNAENNPLLDNVETRFAQIPEYVSTLGAWAHNIIEYPDYTYNYDTYSNQIEDFPSCSSQIQSIARLPNHLELGNYMFFCGGNTRKGTADLFVVKISTQDYPIWFSNLYSGFNDDCFIKHIILEKKHFYQTGGIGICGKYLAIPMSGDHETKISFYDISEPTSPEKVCHSIYRQNSLETCSVSMIRLECGHFLLALWSDMFGLYFYLSKGKTLEHGFNVISHTEMGFFRQFNLAYHGINLVQDFKNRVFLIATQNLSQETTKNCLEKNIADLFLLKKEKDKTITLNHKKRRIFLPLKTSNFNAACSAYVADSENLWLYSCNNFLCEDQHGAASSSTNPNLFIVFDQYGRINNSL